MAMIHSCSAFQLRTPVSCMVRVPLDGCYRRLPCKPVTSACKPKLRHNIQMQSTPRETLTFEERMKDNLAPDEFYYDYPRMCYHADAEFHATLTSLYRDTLPYGSESRILDMMSSWVSHYPTDRDFGRVDGIGMNLEELQRNPQLNFARVWNLNVNSSLPFENAVFDAVTCALSVQYLMYPEQVFEDIGRVLKPGGICIISFSNRMFPAKAVYAWRKRTAVQRVGLVMNYFESTGLFSKPEVVDKTTPLHTISSLTTSYLGFAVTGDPFYAVVARKNSE
eukprot:CAMPEP_0184291810 /NCGR_PEP_ID=MMETSP1049-20130417/3704_1 /TAXON_ID=77928 /ORGANISM="Proteomonas sulcata, Strain CCMP704" /LENGTH=278 /DNA_ID=CAMNT_0026599347 /DNA_START=105 /DNA_END=941 /DNA_ORIENTATION=+